MWVLILILLIIWFSGGFPQLIGHGGFGGGGIHLVWIIIIVLVILMLMGRV